MNIVPSPGLVMADPLARRLVNDLNAAFRSQDTSDCWFYHSFPLYKDSEGNKVLADALFVSPQHGVVAFALPAGVAQVEATMSRFEHVPAHIHSRLIRTKALRSGLSTLVPTINAALVLFDDTSIGTSYNDVPIICDAASLSAFLSSLTTASPLSEEVFAQLLATLAGAKGLIRPQPRQDPNAGAKAKIAYLVETAINDFDLHQKHGMFGALTGPTRIRGIAGSGKTVVLAMKAALIHLANPDAHILYTYYTKSLFQHVQRLITRFYRQFDDRDPNWDRIHILHGWGGKTMPGVYFNQAKRLGVDALTYSTARIPALLARREPFDFACKQIEDHPNFSSLYDYVLVDEAQDFPPTFIRLCHRLAHNGRFAFAYDELQNIFQPSAPTVDSIFGGTVTLTDDVVLRVCYRNPKEILLCAHAIGFGFYGTLVQTLDGAEHWQSLGYNIIAGSFQEGDTIVLERPDDTSLTLVSSNTDIDSIVSAIVFNSDTDEASAVSEWIVKDIKEGGLHPDDIMVVTVDDRNARTYLRQVQHNLVKAGIPANNVHEDTGSLKAFWIDGHVTLSTVHKAKGNEAFAVYVVGVDAPMRMPKVRNRNILFTAMTRAKAWLRVTGVGDEARAFATELQQAKDLCPRIQFIQPSPAQIELIKRDIAESLDRKAKVQKVLSDLLDLTDEVDPDEVMTLLRRSKSKRGKGQPTTDDASEET